MYLKFNIHIKFTKNFCIIKFSGDSAYLLYILAYGPFLTAISDVVNTFVFLGTTFSL